MADTRLYVHVLLDRSGSMESCRAATINAFNAYIEQLAGQSTKGTRLSLTIFDSESTDTLYTAKRIGEVEQLTNETFQPRASTPLFDAVGAVVRQIDGANLLPDERVALTILTDGQENASREMTADAVKKMLVDRQERKNWLVQYLGANQDAWAQGATIGVAAAHALDYDTSNIKFAMSTAAESARRYRSAPAPAARAAATFTPEERASAKAPPSKT